MTAFYAPVEHRDNPTLLGKPVAAGHGASLALISSVYPLPKGIRPVRVTLANFAAMTEPPALDNAAGALL